MAQRMIKIVLPEEYGRKAQELLEEQENVSFWQEELADGSSVISVLADSRSSEKVMDLFEQRYGSVSGFKIVLLPVEASVPRLDKEESERSTAAADHGEKKRFTPLRISREELYSDIAEGTELSNVYIFMMILSTVVAAIGLMKDNVAVIIGAMVIAPFLGPNVAFALSANLADHELGFDAMKAILWGVIVVLLLSAGMGYLFDADPEIPEIAARTTLDLSDIILALASGCAGVLAFTTGTSSAVIGVMVAVALLPPLTVCGLMLGAGYLSRSIAAFLLFLNNIICINLAGVGTFLLQGVSPRAWWEVDRAKKATRRALAIWSLMLVALAVVIYLWQTEL